ncbi:MAG: 23S rRNA (guanosine(2251)-2'-O)-methyltransferase RlmB [Clostridiales bacterium]|nr:23S rRNA (guanosine(2251)-2'-O)-methyltransferase RlmB [Clostridiales bacterium]
MRGGFDDEGSRYGGKPQKGGFRSEGRSSDRRFGDDRKPQKGGFRGEGRTGDRRFGDDRKPQKGGFRSDDRTDRRFGDDRKPVKGGFHGDDRRPAKGGFRSDDRTDRRFGDDRRAPKGGFRSDDRPRFEDRRPREESGYDRYRYDAPVAYDNPAQGGESEIVPNENLLSGRNPIREALKSGRDIEKLLVARGELSGSAREIVQMAKERHIPVQEVDRIRLDAITHNHQGMLAFASAYQYSTVEAMLALAEERGEEPFLVLLDGITDPHNLGAIIRTAECAGAHGVIVQERRAVGLTPAAVKASAGAVEHLPVARVSNLGNTIIELQNKNIWVYAADMEGENYAEADLTGALALVIGAEGEGVSRRVLSLCDKTLSLPMRGKLDSLNASVAAGILLYAAMRAR